MTILPQLYADKKVSFQIFGAIRCPRYSLTTIWLKIKHFEKQIVFVDVAVNTPLKLVMSYCDMHQFPLY